MCTAEMRKDDNTHNSEGFDVIYEACKNLHDEIKDYRNAEDTIRLALEHYSTKLYHAKQVSPSSKITKKYQEVREKLNQAQTLH